MAGKLVAWDSEFSDTSEESLFPVCFAYHSMIDGVEQKGSVWCVSEEGKQEARDLFNSWEADGCTLVAFAVEAEARFLLSLGIDPRRFKWIDMRLEWSMLINHSKWSYGKHMIDGKVKNLKPPVPKWEREEGYKPSGKASTSLVAATYKMLGIERDAENKDEMRDLILSKKEFTDIEEISILTYCEEDVIHLLPLLKALYKAVSEPLKPEDRKLLKSEMYRRADYAVATALMVAKGYPIDYNATLAFSRSVKSIVFQMQTEVNEAFPEVGAFLISNKGDKYTQKKKAIQNWIRSTGITKWTQTDKGDTSLSLDAFEQHFSHKNDQKVFGNRFVKYLRDKQSLNGFSANTSKKTLWDYVGSDKRVRPHFNIYGAQSSRSQPSATGYILLKSSWMRVLMQPAKGKCMIAIDYGQQEFLLAGLLSNDPKMIEAYHSGDPYLYTGKLAGAIPWDATKETHGFMRDKFKSTVLGIQYGMTKFGLAKKLTTDTGVEHTEDEAEELIELFEESYPTYVEWKEDVWDKYLDDGYLKLPCGWIMYGANKNKRSTLNCPVQGLGAAIMREAVKKGQSVGIDIVKTLHDALYAEVDSKDVLIVTEKLAWCMSEAFKYYFLDTPVEKYAVCRMDPVAWSPDFDNSTVATSMGDMKLYSKYIDQKRFEDYLRYRKYFVPKEDLDLLTSM